MDIPATSDAIPGTLVLRDSANSVSISTLNRADSVNILYSTSVNGVFRVNQQDGTGRINVAWNVAGSSIGSGTYFSTAGSEAASRIVFDGNFRVFTAPAGAAGVPISWSEKLSVTADGGVGIGNRAPSAAAILDVASTTQGFLPPRMTTTERDAITSPPAGLMLYNSTTNKLQVRTDTTWVDLH